MVGTFAAIPLVDIGDLDQDRPALAETFRAVLRDVGFAYIAGHGVPQSLIKDQRNEARRFFDLPAEAKNANAINEWHRGYMAPNSSTIVTSSVAKVIKPNQSESFLALHEVSPDDPAYGTPLQGPNQWPAGLPSFRHAATAYASAMEGLARRLMPVMALALGLDENYFTPFFERPTTFLRLLHYPPQPIEEGLFGSAPHTDYGFITLLAQDDVGGLEVRNKAGEWIAAPPVENTFVMNVGDILARWSGGLFASTPHRVINTSGRERYSQPFFFDPAMDAVIEPAVDNGVPFAPVRYGDYLMERIDKNYSYRAGTKTV